MAGRGAAGALGRPAVGIDLGTTKCCVGLFRGGRVEILSDAQGLRSTPSCVAFTAAGRLLGDAARSQAARNAPNTVFGAKRLLGRVSGAAAERDARRWPFAVREAEGGARVHVSYKGAEKAFFPEEISAMLLGHLKELAEEQLGQPVTHAVVTVPAHFNDSQRQATRDAAGIAGISVLRILNETTAAALAYSLQHPDGGERTVLIFDMGGGALSASVVSVDGGVVEVKAAAGDSHLGGDDFDDCLVSFFLEEFLREHRENISHDRRALCRLRAACEAAKRALSCSQKATVSVERLYRGIDLQAELTRAQFEQLCAKLFHRVLRPVERVLRDAGLSPRQVDDVVVVGAAARTPRVRELLRDFFGGRPLNQSLNADEAVASGAAVQAAILLQDGSAAARGLVALDVASVSLGVEASTGKMHGLVKRNTAIPTVATRTFTTLHDHQPDLLIRTYEGERSMARDNHLLGRFLLRGFSPALRGMSLLEVTFYVDADGILSVFALDKIMGSANPVAVDARKGRLSREQIARLAEEHERYRAEDRAQRWRLAAKNYLQACAFSVKRASEDVLSYLALQARRKMLEKCQQAISWLSPAAWLRRRRRRSGAGKAVSGKPPRGFKSLDNNPAGIKKKAKLIITTHSWTWQLTHTTTVIDT